MQTVVRVFYAFSLGVTPWAIAAPAQQNKMKACNEQGNEKGFGEEKGDERKAFMNAFRPSQRKAEAVRTLSGIR
jgi:hypothetical protein